ncbi:MAG: hypothetical protein PVG51_10035 [Desulfosarcina sp.]
MRSSSYRVGDGGLFFDDARACPPEDVGGVPGYTEFLKSIKNKRHAEHEHYQTN